MEGEEREETGDEKGIKMCYMHALTSPKNVEVCYTHVLIN